MCRDLVFPTIGSGVWTIPDDTLTGWLAAYPHLDVIGECRRAWVWIQANPARRKTAKGMPRFLVNWLNRAYQQTVTPSVYTERARQIEAMERRRYQR